jgi:CubicO group peptidase (beta-lactamase class C family)
MVSFLSFYTSTIHLLYRQLGPSVDIQGYLIEKWSGLDLSDFFQQRIFNPLGMVDTGFFIPAEKQSRIVRLHGWSANGTVIAGPNNPVSTTKPKFLAGGGGLSGTILDYWRFTQMILNKGEFNGKRLLKSETIKIIDQNVLEPGIKVLMRPGFGFGMDYAISLDPVAAKTAQPKGSFFWGGAFSTWFWIDPVNDLVVIGLVQNSGMFPKGMSPDDLREMSAEAIYKALGKSARKTWQDENGTM